MKKILDLFCGAGGAVMLCGEMFGLRVMRHRFFECSFPVHPPTHPKHNPAGGIRKQGDGGYYYRVYGHETGKAEWGKAMGIDWMKSPELAQSIPPAYSRFIAEQFKSVQEQVQIPITTGPQYAAEVLETLEIPTVN